ncbi:MAG: nucleotidyltransferase domain-containing protein [Nitrososphaerales archaeon]
MDRKLYGAIEERRKKRLEVIERVKVLCKNLRKKYPLFTIMLIGSFSRGDFNLHSDIDILIIFDKELPKSPLERYKLVEDFLEPNMEAQIIGLKEFKKRVEKRDPVINKILKDAMIIEDDLNVKYISI